MASVQKGQLRGSFSGFKDTTTTFEFMGGGVWKQAHYRYHYHYAYMPQAEVYEDAGRSYLRVQGINDSIEVTRVR